MLEVIKLDICPGYFMLKYEDCSFQKPTFWATLTFANNKQTFFASLPYKLSGGNYYCLVADEEREKRCKTEKQNVNERIKTIYL